MSGLQEEISRSTKQQDESNETFKNLQMQETAEKWAEHVASSLKELR